MLISIIIPTYNDNESLRLCLAAIADSECKPHEVIVVDDGSDPPAKGVVAEFGYICVRLDRNGGQAAARNEGSRIARGDILFFVDADVAVRRDTICRVSRAYESDAVSIFQGIPSKKPLNSGFGPELLSLKMYFMLRDCRSASYVHSHVFSIRRSVFEEAGGFDSRYTPPGCGEEFELGHRLRRNYTIHTDPELVVDQKGVSVFPRMITLYHRAYAWASLFAREGKFEGTNASLSEALLGGISLVLALCLALSLFRPVFLTVAGACLAAHLLAGFRFYRFLAAERGVVFMARSIVPNMLWLGSATVGGMHYLLKSFIGRYRENG